MLDHFSKRLLSCLDRRAFFCVPDQFQTSLPDPSRKCFPIPMILFRFAAQMRWPMVLDQKRAPFREFCKTLAFAGISKHPIRLKAGRFTRVVLKCPSLPTQMNFGVGVAAETCLIARTTFRTVSGVVLRPVSRRQPSPSATRRWFQRQA